MMKLHNVLLACALGAGSLLGAMAPASAAPTGQISAGATRSATTGRVAPGNRYYGPGYRGYGYRYGYPRYGYGYPRYGYGYGYPYGGVSIGVGFGGYGYGGYGYVGAPYGYAAPYPAVYGPRPYYVRRPYWRPYRRAYWGPRYR